MHLRNSFWATVCVTLSTLSFSVVDTYATPVITLSGSSGVTISVGSGVPSSTVYTETTETNAFATGGVAQGWRSDDSGWDFALPFSFTYYGVNYATGHTIRVSSNGRICLDGVAACNETSGMLASNAIVPTIAPLWRDLYTAHSPTDNIYVTQTSDSLTIRWQATSCCGPDEPVNFSATLFRNGDIRFDYGAQPTAYTSIYQQVGISGGTGSTAIISPKSTLTTYNFVTSSRFSPALVYDDPGATWTDATDGAGTILRATSGSVDVNTVGTYILTYSYTNTLGQTGTIDRTVNVVPIDSTVPVVTLIGSGSINIEQGDLWSDPGATWSDNVDGTGAILMATSGSMNTSQTGVYILEYRYTDAAGNISTPATRIITVVDPCSPGTEYNGTSCAACSPGTYNPNVGGACIPAPLGFFVSSTGATSADYCLAGTYTSSTGRSSCTHAPPGTYISGTGAIGAVQCSPGSYADMSGMNACLPCPSGYSNTSSGMLLCYDITPPVLTLIGTSPLSHRIFTSFVDPGVSWTDNSDGSGTILSAYTGMVNTNMLGNYTLTYRYIDGGGNTGSISRVVSVISPSSGGSSSSRPVSIIYSTGATSVSTGSTLSGTQLIPPIVTPSTNLIRQESVVKKQRATHKIIRFDTQLKNGTRVIVSRMNPQGKEIKVGTVKVIRGKIVFRTKTSGEYFFRLP